MANVVRDGLWPCVCLERVRWQVERTVLLGRCLCVRFERVVVVVVVVVVVRVVRTERC